MHLEHRRSRLTLPLEKPCSTPQGPVGHPMSGGTRCPALRTCARPPYSSFGSLMYHSMPGRLGSSLRKTILPLAALLLLLATHPTLAECEEAPLDLYLEPTHHIPEKATLLIRTPSSRPLEILEVRATPPLVFSSLTYPDANLIRMTPAEHSVGTYLFTISAADVTNCTARATTRIRVLDAPDLTISPARPVTISEGATQEFTVSIHDTDEPIGHEITWVLDGKVLPGTTSTSYTPGLNDAGLHKLLLIVKDNHGATSTHTWDIDVGDANRAPAFTYPLPDRKLEERSSVQIYNLSNHAQDPDNQTLTYTYAFINTSNTTLATLATEPLEIRIDRNGLVTAQPRSQGNYFLTITATDPFGKSATSRIASIIVGPQAPKADLEMNHSLCGDGICQDFEICDCIQDCGPCREALSSCIPRWECTPWGACQPEGVRTRICTDLNNCGTEEGSPPESELCLYEGTCDDGVWNQGEEALDCGGPCPPCPTCTDGIQNGLETGTDCGGTCDPCPGCTDGIKNHNESDIDCGGPCTACSPGASCRVAEDCKSTVCSAGQCLAPSCQDNVRNQDETGTDCGGPCEACPTCWDGILNQGEELADCGGPCRACTLSDRYPVKLITSALLIALIVFGTFYFTLRAILNSTFLLLARQDTYLTFMLNRPLVIRALILIAEIAGTLFRRTPTEAITGYLKDHEALLKKDASAPERLHRLRRFFSDLEGLDDNFSLRDLGGALRKRQRGLIASLLLLILARRLAQLESGISLDAYTIQETDQAGRIIRSLRKHL
ncbi:MAG: hypothetical protein HC945_00005 [Nitrosarchaeum sp.]|nr:hypothetical protein [Nitrosarchaeum sp.]